MSYFANGRLAGLQRGAMSERTDIDKQGRIVSRMFADGKVWSYTYLEKVGNFWSEQQRYIQGSLSILEFMYTNTYAKKTKVNIPVV